MILYKLKSDLQMALHFIIEFGKITINMAGSQGNGKKNNDPKTLLSPCIILTMELLLYVDTF